MPDLRVLLVEDNEDDALLLINELRFGGYQSVGYHRVETAEALAEALATDTWDIVLSDYNLPGFDGLEALKIVQESAQDIPFILISGVIGEETAVIALKSGAHDYLLKDRLSRLVSAVRREIAEAKRRQALRETQEQLAEAKEMAEVANQRKSQVLAFVAHEFKNPLNAVKIHAELLKKEIAGPLSEKQAEFLDNITMGAQLLQDLVQDILDIAAVEAGKVNLQFEILDLEKVISDVLAIVQPSAKQQEITIISELADNLPEIEADAKRLRQILINLLSNAIKYSRPKQTVTLSMRLDESMQQLHIIVADEGVGMSEEELKQLFTEFYRVYNKFTAQQEGVGLGLALTKRLVELHQGDIKVSSEPEKGSIFTVTLPVRQTVTRVSVSSETVKESNPALLP